MAIGGGVPQGIRLRDEVCTNVSESGGHAISIGLGGLAAKLIEGAHEGAACAGGFAHDIAASVALIGHGLTVWVGHARDTSCLIVSIGGGQAAQIRCGDAVAGSVIGIGPVLVCYEVAAPIIGAAYARAIRVGDACGTVPVIEAVGGDVAFGIGGDGGAFPIGKGRAVPVRIILVGDPALIVIGVAHHGRTGGVVPLRHAALGIVDVADLTPARFLDGDQVSPCVIAIGHGIPIRKQDLAHAPEAIMSEAEDPTRRGDDALHEVVAVIGDLRGEAGR